MATWLGFDDKQDKLETDKTLNLADIERELRSNTGTALLHQQDTIIMRLGDENVEIPIHASDRVVLGRREFNNPDLVTIDLTPYGAREKGVSRRHAALYRIGQTLSIVDLGSNNGTYLNGVRLLPHQPRLLRTGDELALGTMILKIHFEKFGQLVS